MDNLDRLNNIASEIFYELGPVRSFTADYWGPSLDYKGFVIVFRHFLPGAYNHNLIALLYAYKDKQTVEEYVSPLRHLDIKMINTWDDALVAKLLRSKLGAALDRIKEQIEIFIEGGVPGKIRVGD